MAENPVCEATNRLEEWNDSLAGDYFWSNVNFGEAVTKVMTPLTWSVIQFTLEDWIFLPGWPTVGVIGGRPYLNISIFATLFYSIGRSRENLLDFMGSTLYMRLPEAMPIPAIPVARITVLRGMIHAARVQLGQRRGVREAQAYVEANKAWFQGIRAAVQAAESTETLLDLWDSEMATHIKQGVWCVLGTAGHSAEYTLGVQQRLAQIVGPEDANILVGNLSVDEAPLESLGPLISLNKLARQEISAAVYLEEFGHRGPQEFELSVPRPGEDGAWLTQEVAQLRQSPVDVDDLLAQQRRARERAWQRLRRLEPRAATRFRRQLEESARRARLRERARSAYTRDRWAIRLWAIRAGELTGLDQIFFLRLGEILALLAGDRSATDLIPNRIAAYETYRALPSYPSVIRGRFDPLKWAADQNRPRDIYDAEKPGGWRTDPKKVVGSPGSAGVVEGMVRIIDHPDDGQRLARGEILVAAQTDIAWTVLFPRAAAVVTDVGAPLSHAAIVARELGIPAVVGCGNATTVLKTGDRVIVDGGRGTVTLRAG